MGRLLSLARGIEASLWSRFGRWIQEVSTTTDQAVVDIAVLQAAQSREDWKDSVAVAITSALPAFTQDGNTITFDAVGALPAQDGVAIVTQTPPQRVLLAIGTNVYNGIWDVIESGDGATAAMFQRPADADTSADVTSAMRVPVATGGTDHGGKAFRLATSDPITLNTTALTYVEEQGLADGTEVGQLPAWDGSAWGAQLGFLRRRVAPSAPGATASLAVGAAASFIPNTLYEYRCTVLADDATNQAILELTGKIRTNGAGTAAGLEPVDDPLVRIRTGGVLWTATMSIAAGVLTVTGSGGTAGTVWTAIPEFRKAG